MGGLDQKIIKNVWIERHREDLPARQASLGPRLLQSEPCGAVRAVISMRDNHACSEAEGLSVTKMRTPSNRRSGSASSSSWRIIAQGT